MSTSTSGETVTPSLLLRPSTTDTSAATTACNTTFSDSTGKDKSDTASFDHHLKIGRKAFRRLPIPSSLLLSRQEESVRLGYGLPSRPNDEEEEEFPQSPGNSPFSQFKPSSLLKQRHQSASEASLPHNRRQLHPSPPTLVLEPEGLHPERKVLRHKPIPISLLLETDETAIEKQRSWSVPELFTSPTCSDDKVGDIEKGSSLGLYLSTPIELESVKVGGTDNTQPQTSEGKQRLRRVTRSISDSHSNTHFRGVGKVRVELGIVEGSESNSSGEEDIGRGRVRSGSLPSPPSISFYSTHQFQPEQVLRRVSRTKPEMMRSEFLSHPPSTPEMVEVLTTPDPPSFHSFPPTHHQHRREGNISNSLHLSTHDQYWDSLRDTSSRSRSNSETTLASLLLLQQHIQQRNWLRQFEPPSDPHLPADFGTKRSSRGREPSGEEVKVVEAKDGRRKDARVKTEDVDEGMVRKYGAMRIRGWVANDGEAEVEEAEEGERRGLRHMFSNPILGEAGGSLRERRAKPPIRIALSTTASTTTSAGGGGLGGVKRKQSKTILSPTTVAVHSPPPCPPPSTPLPDLPPPPKSAPLTSSYPIPQAQKRVLVLKRSFNRSSSTPVSPFNPTHGQTQSQGQNVLPQNNSSPTSAPIYDTSLLTPPLTGLPSLVFDRQPNTPQSAAVVTPVKANAGGAAGKFEGLFAFLSSKTRTGGGEKGGDEREGGSPRSIKMAQQGAEGERVVTAPNGTPSGVVYGLAL